MIALYTLCIITFAVMVIALIRDPFKRGQVRTLQGYRVEVTQDGDEITEAVLYRNGVAVYRDKGPHQTEKAATLNVLEKYYRQLEKEYIARTRRVNYALGTRETVTKIRATFSHTLQAREVQALMEELKRENTSCKL